MRGEGYWVIRTYEAGPVGEKIKYWVPGKKPVRSGRREKTEIKKQEHNEQSAVKQLARIINANFAQGDFLIGLDYSEEGYGHILRRAASSGMPVGCSEEESMEYMRAAAEHELRLVLRRIKREAAAEGLEVKYVAVTSDMNGDTGEAVRVHHHLVIPRELCRLFVKKWELGGVTWSALSSQLDYTAISEYLLRQVRRIPDAKKFMCSRNLKRPVPKDRIAANDSELRVPRGSRLLHRTEFKPGRPQYIRYTLQNKDHFSASGKDPIWTEDSGG